MTTATQNNTIIRAMTMDDFKLIPHGRGFRPKSQQRIAIEAMKPGDVLVLTHKGITHRAKGCSISGIIRNINKLSDKQMWMWRHLPNTIEEFAVACIATN